MKRPQLPCSIAKTSSTQAAFTRGDLVIAVGILALTFAVTAPQVVGSHADSRRAVCANNLRLIGVAIPHWMADHDAQQPPWRVPVSRGGTQYTPKSANSACEFFSFTNQFPSPKVFACPADATATAALDWSRYIADATNASSYALNLDPEKVVRASVVIGDSNIRYDRMASCSIGMQYTFEVNLRLSEESGWTNGIHGDHGNVLLHDGTVEYTASDQFRELLRRMDGSTSIHFLAPRGLPQTQPPAL